MSRRVREYIEIRDRTAFDVLIATLAEIRDILPDDSEAEVKLTGDDNFGRLISIAYFRPLTAEAERDARYAEACRQSRGLDPEASSVRRRHLRSVA